MPLRFVVCGFLLVICNITIDEFDILPDPVGWLLVVVGLRRLASHFGGSFNPALYFAGAAGVVSIAEFLTVAGGPGSALSMASMMLTLAVEWFVLTGIIERAVAGAAADDSTATRANTLRIGLAVLGVCGLLFTALGASLTSPTTQPLGIEWLIPLVVVWGVVTVVWYVVTLVFWWGKSSRPYLRVR